jgi:hypothetical protein
MDVNNTHHHQGTYMNTHRMLLTAATLACLTVSSASFAVTAAEHASHHPEQATTVKKSKAVVSTKTPPAADMQMDKHMQAMRDMHDKMMNAKTPEERRALMAEQLKTMQDGMAMMSQVCKGDMAQAAMPAASAASGMGMGGMMGGMHHKHHEMMKHMEMMQLMMQALVDRAAAEAP